MGGPEILPQSQGHVVHVHHKVTGLGASDRTGTLGSQGFLTKEDRTARRTLHGPGPDRGGSSVARAGRVGARGTPGEVKPPCLDGPGEPRSPDAPDKQKAPEHQLIHRATANSKVLAKRLSVHWEMKSGCPLAKAPHNDLNAHGDLRAQRKDAHRPCTLCSRFKMAC